MFKIIWITGFSNEFPYAVSTIGVPLWIFAIGGLIQVVILLFWVFGIGLLIYKWKEV